jgi:heme A synthase
MLRNYLYPVLFIALGRQYKEYEKRRKIANILFVTIGLAMIVGIITNIISNALTNLTNG